MSKNQQIDCSNVTSHILINKYELDCYFLNKNNSIISSKRKIQKLLNKGGFINVGIKKITDIRNDYVQTDRFAKAKVRELIDSDEDAKVFTIKSIIEFEMLNRKN